MDNDTHAEPARKRRTYGAATGESACSPRRVAAAEKQRRVLALRLAGASYDQIAHEVGYGGRSSVAKALRAALQRAVQPDAEAYRRLVDARLDALLLAVWAAARRGHLAAVDRVLRIEHQRAELLGLNAPKLIAHTDSAGEEPSWAEVLELAWREYILPQQAAERAASTPNGHPEAAPPPDDRSRADLAEAAEAHTAVVAVAAVVAAHEDDPPSAEHTDTAATEEELASIVKSLIGRGLYE